MVTISNERKQADARQRGALPIPRASRQFWVLSALLCLALFLGGSSRADVGNLTLLRPLSVLLLAYGIFTLKVEKIREYRWPLCLAVALTTLHVVHLIPLPSAIWSAMPGREILQKVDSFIGAGKVWRPVTLDPDGGWNALYALALPVSALALGAQLSKVDHVRLLVVVLGLIALSGLIGVLQAAGADWHPYSRSSGASGLFANRNHQAVMLAISFPMLAVAVAASGDVLHEVRRAKVAGWTLGAVAVPLVVVTGSRAGLLLSIIGISSICVTRLYRPPSPAMADSRFARLYSPWMWGGMALIGALILAWLTTTQSRGVAISRLQTANFELRWPVWQGAWDLAQRYWPVGSGLGSYETVYQVHEPAELLRPTYSNHVHNEWLEILMTAGLPGLLVLLCAVCLFGVALAGSSKASGTLLLLRRLGLVTILLLALASIVDYPVRVPFIACVFTLGWVWSFVSWGNHAE